MGNYFASQMQESMKKNQEDMARLQMERQLQMQKQMQDRLMAMQVAKSRDLCLWVTVFYAIAAMGALNGFRKTRKPLMIAPLIPLTFVTAYLWDGAYGNKVQRIRWEAENIMNNQKHLLGLPCGLPSFATIDNARLKEEERKKIHPILS